ncbi:MAG: DUF3892 domain-containing protein [Firmicutes bacterium]|nr:DUF3892 domain-containing protein [Bacillota bacterium]
MTISRRVKATRKDDDGKITHVCNEDNRYTWSPRASSLVISEIESGDYRYFVKVGQEGEVDIRVVDGANGKYLRTTADSSDANNLDNLPDC